MNAANEVAVEMFLDGKLGFTSIPRVIERTMNGHSPDGVLTIDVIRRVDAWAREKARAMAAELELKV
jgi:1-deoxy-D-xylulose-5-phosphate reductoisomerase